MTGTTFISERGSGFTRRADSSAETFSTGTPVQAATDKDITTIEGIARGNGELHPVQEAWISQQVPQCGYCQSGQIMAAVALLNRNPSPTDGDIDNALNGIICRCGMYGRIRTGIRMAARALRSEAGNADDG